MVHIRNFDVVVVGAGVIGTSSAYYLAKAGYRIALVDRGSVGSGTSSACGDALALQTKAPGPKMTLAAESVRMYHTLGEELDYDLEFRNEGGMVTALTEPEVEHVHALVARLSAAGVPVQLLDGRGAREIQPALSPSLLASTYCPLDCHINPLRVSFAYARAAQRLGATVFQDAEVTGISVGGGKVQSVQTNNGPIGTHLVVNAAGAWSSSIAKMAGLEVAVIPRKGQILVTEALPPTVKGRVFAARYLMSKLGKSSPDGGADYSSGLVAGQQASGNFLVLSTREYVGFDTRSTARAVNDLAGQAAAMLPVLKGVHIVRAFAGLRPATPEGVPVIRRHPELEGMITASGHEGDGICLAPITGRLVVDLAQGRIADFHEFVDRGDLA